MILLVEMIIERIEAAQPETASLQFFEIDFLSNYCANLPCLVLWWGGSNAIRVTVREVYAV